VTAMRTVATKRLKDRLSHYLRLVRAGARFVVTDRGRPIAELRPLEAQRAHADRERAWVEAAARGLVTLPLGRGFARFRPIRLRGGAKVSDAVLEDRR
jgi:antitoxin (DNA-binding transcriptional repressor) of toxin-antitoxin stability system